MKRSLVIILSFFVLYGGVAWALDACVWHKIHSAHAISEDHPDSEAQVSHDDSRDPSVPVIHCTPLTQQMGPAVRVASVDAHRAGKGITLHSASLPDALSAMFRNDLWLEAVFKKIVTVSLAVELARHLFLSVLQI
jgi:hypothetical protein